MVPFVLDKQEPHKLQRHWCQQTSEVLQSIPLRATLISTSFLRYVCSQPSSPIGCRTVSCPVSTSCLWGATPLIPTGSLSLVDGRVWPGGTQKNKWWRETPRNKHKTDCRSGCVCVKKTKQTAPLHRLGYNPIMSASIFKRSRNTLCLRGPGDNTSAAQ